jgi:aspartate dehydrogenase
MRIALIGGGTIARLILEHVRGGTLGSFEVVALMGRAGGAPRGLDLAGEFGVKYVQSRDALVSARPQTVIEAASHDAVKEHLVPLLKAGTGVVVLSAGALIDDQLRHAAEQAAARSGALMFVPSGGIGGLDALKTACLAGVDEHAGPGERAGAGKSEDLMARLLQRARRTAGAAFSGSLRHLGFA